MVEMGDNIESRQEVLTEMKTFIEHECSEIGEILAQLSWTPDHILKVGIILSDGATSINTHTCDVKIF